MLLQSLAAAAALFCLPASASVINARQSGRTTNLLTSEFHQPTLWSFFCNVLIHCDVPFSLPWSRCSAYTFSDPQLERDQWNLPAS